jgi:hypothetical protein
MHAFGHRSGQRETAGVEESRRLVLARQRAGAGSKKQSLSTPAAEIVDGEGDSRARPENTVSGKASERRSATQLRNWSPWARRSDG